MLSAKFRKFKKFLLFLYFPFGFKLYHILSNKINDSAVSFLLSDHLVNSDEFPDQCPFNFWLKKDVKITEINQKINHLVFWSFHFV